MISKHKHLNSTRLRSENGFISFKLKLILLFVLFANLECLAYSENKVHAIHVELDGDAVFMNSLIIDLVNLTVLSKSDSAELPIDNPKHERLTSEPAAYSNLIPHHSWKILLINVFLSGIFLFMFLYHFVQYWISKTDKAILGFSLLLFYLCVFYLFFSPVALEILFPQASKDLAAQLKYFFICLTPLFHILYVSLLYRDKATNRALLYIPAAISACGVLLALFAPLWLISRFEDLFRIYIIIAATLILYFVWVAYKRDEKGGLLVLNGHIALYLSVIGYMIIGRTEFAGTAILAAGNIAFVLFQTYALYSRYQTGIIGLSGTNEMTQPFDKNLEQVLIERSEDLMIEKSLLEEMNRRLQDQKEDMLTQSEMLDDLNQRIEMEMKRSDKLLLNILPENIANELKIHGKAPTHNFPGVTVLFIDFVGFSEIVETVSASELVEELHFYFGNFDDVIAKYNMEKIKTIGDAYMCAIGLKPQVSETDAFSAVYAALEIVEFMESYREERLVLDKFYFKCRIGLHTGAVVAGVVGKTKFAFDIWGQTVNIAKEAESASKPGMITITESTYTLVKDKFICTPRGHVRIKHGRKMPMYFVEGVKIDT